MHNALISQFKPPQLYRCPRVFLTLLFSVCLTLTLNICPTAVIRDHLNIDSTEEENIYFTKHEAEWIQQAKQSDVSVGDHGLNHA